MTLRLFVNIVIIVVTVAVAVVIVIVVVVLDNIIVCYRYFDFKSFVSLYYAS